MLSNDQAQYNKQLIKELTISIVSAYPSLKVSDKNLKVTIKKLFF